MALVKTVFILLNYLYEMTLNFISFNNKMTTYYSFFLICSTPHNFKTLTRIEINSV